MLRSASEWSVKIFCPCGEMIYDGGQTQPDKARFVTCQSEHDFLDSLKTEEVSWRKFFDLLNRDLFQCGACGRLFVEARGEHAGYHTFVPEGEHVPRDLFRTRESREGEA
jgi:hypothetical protein